MIEFASARQAMVENRICLAWVVLEDLIEALHGVPQEHFVPKQPRVFACVDDIRIDGHELDAGIHRHSISPGRPFAGNVLSKARGVVVGGDMRPDRPEVASRDVIVIEGCCDEMTRDIAEQLSPGRPTRRRGSEATVGRAVVIRRDGVGNLGRRSLFDALLPPLECFGHEPEFRL